MNEWTVILASAVVIAHCVAIFWPRKPLNVPTDENGLPVLWRNESAQSKDVACVWWDEENSAPTSATAKVQTSRPLSFFGESIQTFATEDAEHRRHVA
jgi:hypothetical protein